MILLYNFLNIIFLPIWTIYLLYRASKGKECLSRLGERFGIAGRKVPKHKKVIWLHVASVGEALSVLTLIKKLKTALPNYCILMTSSTVTSTTIIHDRLQNNVIHQYLPLDNYICINLFLNYWQPKLVLFVDSEFWPCILTVTAKKTKIISLNTRISPSSCQKWKKHPRIAKYITNSIALFLPQSLDDQNRIEAIGAKNVVYVGNLKYCNNNNIIDDRRLVKLRNLFKNRKTFLVASTHENEEELAAEIYCELKQLEPELLMILAPRHPVRAQKIIQILVNNYQLKTAIHSKAQLVKHNTDTYLVDTIGELNYFYNIAPISIIGGSFVDIGGHNPIEPATFGSTIIMGPHIFNFAEICNEFAANKAAFFVNDKRGCISIVQKLLNNNMLREQYATNAKKIVNSKNKILDVVLEKILDFT